MAPLRIRDLRSSCTKRFQDSWAAPHWTRGPGRFSPCVAGRLRISTSTTSQPPSDASINRGGRRSHGSPMWCGWPPPSFDSDTMIFTIVPIPRLYIPTPPGKSITSNQRQRVHFGELRGWVSGVFSWVSRRPSDAGSTNKPGANLTEGRPLVSRAKEYATATVCDSDGGLLPALCVTSSHFYFWSRMLGSMIERERGGSSMALCTNTESISVPSPWFPRHVGWRCSPPH
jgi:hypothetical protein